MERTATDRVNDPVIGRLLDGRYLVGHKIARGGMATVYAATDTRLQRSVAVKVMHPGLGDDETFLRRFRREAQAAARLAHQNVVAVFDQGDDDGVLFLVMEHVSGITLRDLIHAEAPIPPIKALAVIEPVLAALASAHHGGMIHRDVKPENVLLSDDGRVKVADFGLARAVNSQTQHTGTGVLIGTVSYLSPELVVAGQADARADVYAAGVLIYEMLTGRKPHRADSPIQVAYKHVHEDVPAPSAEVPGLPPYVDALVARATARDLEKRPVDAGVLLGLVRRVRAALEDGLADDPDLVADLLPGGGRRDPFLDTDDQMPRVIIDPSQDTGEWSAVDELADSGPVPVAAPRQAQHRGRPEARDDDPEAWTTAYPGAAAVAAPEPVAALADERYDAAYSTDDDRDWDEPDVPSAVTGGAARSGRGRSRGQVRRRRTAVLLSLALVVALLIGFGAYYFGVARYTVTPGVINLKQSAARSQVEKAGLAFRVTRSAYSEQIAAGSVLATDPEAGSKILKSGTVGVIVSRGPERHAVPDVRGGSLDAAQAALQDADLSFGKAVNRYDEDVAKGKVISTSPKVGSELRRETAVDVVVSQGRRPIEVTDYTGEPYQGAVKALEAAGLSVSTTQSYDDDVARGDVARQSPSEGTLYRGDKVSLVVSRGPNLVTVPKVRQLPVEKARDLLEAKGFKVKLKQSKQYAGLRFVLSSNPRAGTQAPKGSTITLSLV